MDDEQLNREEINRLIYKIGDQIINTKLCDNEISLSIKKTMNIWEWESGVALFALYLF
jgi:hypothetical protein